MKYRPITLAAFFLLGVVRPTVAQCVEWSSGEFVAPALVGEVNAMVVFDDGSGPALVAAGSFVRAGQVAASSIVRFDGRDWAPLGRGLTRGFLGRSGVTGLAVFDDGNGAALYACGSLLIEDDPVQRSIARWDGRRWSAVGGDSGPSSCVSPTVFDDGSGPALYAVGSIPGPQGGSGVIKWDGAAWTLLDTRSRGDISIFALVAFDDGTGPALWVAARDYRASGPGSLRVARWNGTSWRNAGAGLDGLVRTFLVHDDGSGSALYAGGEFAGGSLARWDGSAWRAISPAVNGTVLSLASFDDGTGRKLAVGGAFDIVGGTTAVRVALFDGISWTPLGDGPGQPVQELAVFDSGAGPTLYAGTEQKTPPPPLTPYLPLARWDGARWLPAGPGFDAGPAVLTVFDDGRGPALFASGNFLQAGDVAASGLARFDGTAWSEVGGGLAGGPRFEMALAEFDDGAGPALYVGGQFESAGGVAARNIVRWDGTAFSPLGSGLDGPCTSLTVFDDGSGPALYAGGRFLDAGGVAARRVARWDGAAWTPLGSGTNGSVVALATIDDGTGPAIIAAGAFSRAGGATTIGIAKWDGVAWRGLSSGTTGAVIDIVEFDFGAGPRLVAGGSFLTIGGVVAPSLAVWDGAAWTPLVPPDPTLSVESLMRVDVPGGPPQLFASGCDPLTPLEPRCYLSKWTASGWNRMQPDPTGIVTSLAAFDDGFGTSLFASGRFAGFGAGASVGFARLSSGDVAPRLGNVNAGRGAIADVLTLNGSSGDASCRRVVVEADAPQRIDVLLPPAGGRGDYVFWIENGTPDPRRPVRSRLLAPGGTLVDLGLSPRALPIENLVTPGAVRCPLTFRSGFASRPAANPASALTLCVHPGDARLGPAPASLTLAFPYGTYTIAGVITDPGSANARPLSLTNALIVEAR